jgi:hypothetical protein
MTRAALALVLSSVSAAMGAGRLEAQGQGKLASAAPVTYDNKFEVYGGINYMLFQASPAPLKLMNLGGAEIAGTWWLSDKWGAVADYRGDAGTTAVVPNPVFNGNALVVLQTGMLGAQYRVVHNQRAALNLHAYAGVSHGWFNETLQPAQSGLYNNITKPMETAGLSVDFNRSKNLAIRLQPDVIVEQFGPGTRTFYSVSLGAVYRIGKR